MLRLPRHWISGRFPSAILMGNSPPASQSPSCERTMKALRHSRPMADGWRTAGGRTASGTCACARFLPMAPRRPRSRKEEGGLRAGCRMGASSQSRTDDHRLMVVDYHVKNATFIAGKPQEWTPVRLADTGVISNFDVLATASSGSCRRREMRLSGSGLRSR